MAKGEAKSVNNNMTQQLNSGNSFMTDYQRELLDKSHNAYNTNTVERQNLNEGYGNLAATGGITEDDKNRLRGFYTGLQGQFNSGGGGGAATPAYTYAGNVSPVQNTYADLMNGGGVNRYALGTLQELAGKNGGWSDENLAKMKKGIAGFEEIGNTGGYSDAGKASIQADIEKMRQLGILDPATMAKFNTGLAGYEDLARTGGWSDSMKTDYMNKATGVIPAMYAQANQQAQRAGNIQGGAPGLSYSLRNNMRAAAADAQAAAREGRLGMENSILSNKVAGLGGLTTNALAGAQAINDAGMRSATNAANTQQALEQALVQNKLAGLGGMTSNTQGMQDSINSSRLGASNALNNLTQIDLQAKLAGTSGYNDVVSRLASESAASAAAANAANRANFDEQMALAKFGTGIEQYLLDSGNANKLAGLGGMKDIYGMGNTLDAQYTGDIFQNRQIGNQNAQNMISQQAAYNPNVSGWDRFNQTLGTLGQIGGAVAGAMSGNPTSLAGLGGMNRPSAGVLPLPQSGNGLQFFPGFGNLSPVQFGG